MMRTVKPKGYRQTGDPDAGQESERDIISHTTFPEISSRKTLLPLILNVTVQILSNLLTK